MDIYGCQPTFMCPETANLHITDIVVKLIISTSDCNLIRIWYEFRCSQIKYSLNCPGYKLSLAIENET